MILCVIDRFKLASENQVKKGIIMIRSENPEDRQVPFQKQSHRRHHLHQIDQTLFFVHWTHQSRQCGGRLRFLDSDKLDEWKGKVSEIRQVGRVERASHL